MPLGSVLIKLAVAVLALHPVVILLLGCRLSSCRPSSTGIIIRSPSVAHRISEHLTLRLPLGGFSAEGLVLLLLLGWSLLGGALGRRGLVVGVLVVIACLRLTHGFSVEHLALLHKYFFADLHMFRESCLIEFPATCRALDAISNVLLVNILRRHFFLSFGLIKLEFIYEFGFPCFGLSFIVILVALAIIDLASTLAIAYIHIRLSFVLHEDLIPLEPLLLHITLLRLIGSDLACSWRLALLLKVDIDIPNLIV